MDHSADKLSPCPLSEGISLRGKPSPTHKCVAKQPQPIEKNHADLIEPPLLELHEYILNKWMEREGGGYVDRCPDADSMIQRSLSLMPKSEVRKHKTQKLRTSIFPRSRQYELWYIQNKRKENFEKRMRGTPKLVRKEKDVESYYEPCDLLRPPFWWKGEGERFASLPDADVNNNVVEDLQRLKLDDETSEKGSHLNKHVPAAKCAENLPAEDVDSTEIAPENAPDFPCDKRWQSISEWMSFPDTNEERDDELRKLTKPFLHDLHIWYTKNKPTKSALPITYTGKKPILERRFSHL